MKLNEKYRVDQIYKTLILLAQYIYEASSPAPCQLQWKFRPCLLLLQVWLFLPSLWEQEWVRNFPVASKQPPVVWVLLQRGWVVLVFQDWLKLSIDFLGEGRPFLSCSLGLCPLGAGTGASCQGSSYCYC